mgnify:CR=1 FL=1
MEIIYRGCRSGKTTELIKQSIENGYTIVCNSKKEAESIYKQGKILKEAKLSKYIESQAIIPFPIIYDEFITKKWLGKQIKGFLIDDVDRLLELMCLPNLVKVVTITNYENR